MSDSGTGRLPGDTAASGGRIPGSHAEPREAGLGVNVAH